MSVGFLDDYELLARAGAGGMGTVWRARHRRAGVEVAVKVIKRGDADDVAELRGLQRELEALATLRHRGIVGVLDFGTVDHTNRSDVVPGSVYFVMEWVPGSLVASVSGMSWPGVFDTLSGLLEALAHAHARGVIHRDVKPSNVLLSHDDDRLVPRLCDFGIAARFARNVEHDDGTTISGTPPYMAPEQVTGAWRDHGPWTDLYALGGLAHWLVTGGRLLYSGDTDGILRAKAEGRLPAFEEFLIDVSDGFREWVTRLLAFEPTARYQLAADALADLRAIGGPRDRGIGDRGDHPPDGAEPPAFANRWGSPKLFLLRPIPMVDRVDEIAVLDDELHAVSADQRSRCIEVRGPSGVGKARLAEWFARRANEAGEATMLAVKTGRDPGAFGRMMLHETRCGGLEPSAAVERIRDWYSKYRPVDDEALLDCVSFASWMGHSEVELDRHTAVDSASRFVELVATERPVVLVLEGVREGDVALDVAKRLADRRGRVLVVITTSDSEVTLGGTSIDLEPLSEEHHRELVGRLLPLEPELGDRVAERTMGMPLYAVEVVRDFVQRGVLEPTAEGLSLTVADPPLPASLQNLFWSRIRAALADLTEESRHEAIRALHLAAAIGTVVERDLWEAVADECAVWIPPDLEDRLRRARLITDDVLGWRWSQSGAREAVADHSRADGRWQTDNRVCADVVAGVDVFGASMQLRRGRHLFEARDDRALEVLRAAATRARALGRVDDAREALALHAQAIERAGPEGREEAMVLADIGESRLRVMLNEPGVRRELDELVRRAAGAGPAAYGRALQVRGVVRRIDGQLDGSLDDLRQAVMYLDQAGESYHLALARLNLSSTEKYSAMWDAALNSATASVRWYRGAGEVHREADATEALSAILLQRGEFDAAAAALDRAIELARVSGSRMLLARSYLGHADLERWRGRPERSEGYVDRAERVFDDARFDAWLTFQRALNAVDMGHHDEANELLDDLEASQLLRKTMVDWGTIQFARAWMAALDGNHAAYRVALQRSKSAVETGKVSRECATYARRAADLGEERGWSEASEARAAADRMWSVLP